MYCLLVNITKVNKKLLMFLVFLENNLVYFIEYH